MANQTAVTTESGLTYIITKAGGGAEVKAGNEVVVNYTGLLSNGVMFDSSLVRNELFSFPVGLGMVIKGWDEGLQRLHIPHAILSLQSKPYSYVSGLYSVGASALYKANPREGFGIKWQSE